MLPSCSSPSFHDQGVDAIPDPLRPPLTPLLETIMHFTQTIRGYDRQIGQRCALAYPETDVSRSVPELGPVTALTHVLILEEAERFPKSRSVAAFCGLVPGATRLAQPIDNFGSPRQATVICAGSWSDAPRTFWAPLARLPSYEIGVSNWPNAAGQTANDARWWPSPASPRSCCIGYGRPASYNAPFPDGAPPSDGEHHALRAQ